jgi:uncharacterized RDD family membrane protein YckC
MPAFCPECGNVPPQEAGGSAMLRCPRCGRTLLVEQPAWGDPISAAHPAAAGAYGGYGYGAALPAYGELPAAPRRIIPRPDELARQYDGWIVAHRWLATLIDHVVLLLGMAGLLVGAEALLGSELYQKTVVLWLLPLLAYFPVLEGLYGATPGKRLAGLRVVDADGNPPGLWKASVRTVLRLIEVNPLMLGGIVAAICVLCTRSRQRLGDMAAGTYVLTTDDARAAQGRRF